MTSNVGTIDRALRLFIGVLLFIAPFVTGIGFLQSTPGTVVAVVVGLVMIGTAATGFCPMYRVMGLRT